MKPTSIEHCLSSPELWLYGVFVFLSTAELGAFSTVNRFFLTLVRSITYPTRLGIFPISLWLDHIIPRLGYKQLKCLQRTNRAANQLMRSKSLAGPLFRADMNSQTLKNLPVGSRLKLHPFFKSLDWDLHSSYDSIGIFSGSKCPKLLDLKVSAENACYPPVMFLSIRFGVAANIRVLGTGNPLYGGKSKAVTCRDVMLAFATGCGGIHYYFGEFNAFAT